MEGVGMFVTEMEGEDYTYAHCYEDDDEGNEFGCGMEYEFYPEHSTLHYWHDAVGLVTRKAMTEDEWNELVKWHNENCTTETGED
jgi:hypothetical protein